MAEIHRIDSNYAMSQVGIIRDRDSRPDRIRAALSSLGAEVGRHILDACRLVPAIVTTPMSDRFETLVPTNVLTVVVTTKTDLQTFGRAIAGVLKPAKLGYMNFEGRRGLDALNASVREVELPVIRRRVVDSVVIAKSILATGCTAISLTRTAIQEYAPRNVVIATIFYSESGVQELEDAFPNARIFVVGKPDELDDDGMLRPGVGLLDERV